MLGRLGRVAAILLTLLAVFAATRALVRALPGDPAETLAAESGTVIPIESLRSELALDRPFLPALASDLSRFVRGDWGRSLFSRAPVAPLVRRRFGRTLELTLLALALGLSASLLLGLAAAPRPGGRVDRACELWGAVTAALPTPWIGPMLLALFAVEIPLFPAGGHPALPAVTLALGFSGLWARLIRERVRESLRAPAATAARARGLGEARVTLKYGLAPGAGALLAYLGTQAGGLLAGAFVTEVLFDWRGIGSLLVESVLKRDYPVVEACVFVAAACSLLGTAVGDWLQDAVDPRLR
jgi:peptide/nickel transport system permease protein